MGYIVMSENKILCISRERKFREREYLELKDKSEFIINMNIFISMCITIWT